jgi:hypothetical protein
LRIGQSVSRTFHFDPFRRSTAFIVVITGVNGAYAMILDLDTALDLASFLSMAS